MDNENEKKIRFTPTGTCGKHLHGVLEREGNVEECVAVPTSGDGPPPGWERGSFSPNGDGSFSVSLAAEKPSPKKEKGSGPGNYNSRAYVENYDRIFGKKTPAKA